MATPFPGLDPYLEAQDYWEDFHAKFINYAQEMIADCLPDHYEARIEELFSLVFGADPHVKQQVKPEVVVLRHGASSPAPEGREPRGIATFDPVTVPLTTDLTDEIREHRIEIRRRPGRTLVAVVEVLSPSNKTAPGRRIYVEKRLELIHQPVHLVELDLLIEGQRLPMDGPLPAGDYYALVSRSDRRPNAEVYAWSVRQPLPTIPVPLDTPDPDVPLDLAAVFNTVYERGRYARSIDYGVPLSLPLGAEDRAWAEALARTAGG